MLASFNKIKSTSFSWITLTLLLSLSVIPVVLITHSLQGSLWIFILPQMLWLHKKCISDVQEAITHAGQVLRLVREMPRGIRPPWWPAAIYRASLVLWTDSLTHNESAGPRQQGVAFPVDRLPADHQTVLRYLSRRDGIPTLTKLDGTPIPLDSGFSVLSHCIDVIDEGVATRFSDGIRAKLEKLARG